MIGSQMKPYSEYDIYVGTSTYEINFTIEHHCNNNNRDYVDFN